MNSIYFDFDDELKSEFKACFCSNEMDDASKFKFFRKILMFVENDVSSFNHLILLENPLKNEEYYKFMTIFNHKCKEFLESRSKNNSEPKNKKNVGLTTCYIGAAHEYGLFGYKRDFHKAFESYLLSSQLNDAIGTYKLAQCFEKGKGTNRDAEKALYFYRCAAKLGETDALHTYGMVLAKGGLGAEIDEKTGLHFLSLASIQSDKVYPYAQFDIGRWYETIQETLDVTVDEGYAFDIYLKGAKLNDPNCQYRIAACYEDGDLKTAKDLNKAAFWYQRAAEGGHLDAQMFLAELYTTGMGSALQRDLAKAFFWTLQAGTRGCPIALLHLGDYTRTGEGTSPDILQSMWWYLIASIQGSPEAKVKYEETKAEVERIDDGPQIEKSCCFFC